MENFVYVRYFKLKKHHVTINIFQNLLQIDCTLLRKNYLEVGSMSQTSESNVNEVIV